MISGVVSSAGVPVLHLEVAGRSWEAIVDTGFNGDLELPVSLKDALSPRYIGQITSLLAAGQAIKEDAYHVDFPFDGRTILSEATFVSGEQVLVGTHLLQHHRLEVDFPAGTVTLQRTEKAAGW